MFKKTAVLAYPRSNNLGDFIQSIAASHWIKDGQPFYLDRDQLHRYNGEKVKLIMNGWFMEAPTHWPPSKNIEPLFISFHLNPTAEKGMLTPEGIAYIKQYQPIGCRDFYTQRTLEKHGIKTYFSGCLTLSLKREAFLKKDIERTGILVISPLERLLPQGKNQDSNLLKRQFLNGVRQIKQPFKNQRYKQATKRLNDFLIQLDEEIQYHSQLLDPQRYSETERIQAAEEQLMRIGSAKMVITSRIHSALPAVAFGTPVLFLSDGLEHPNQKSRLEGMESFFRILNTEALVKESNHIPNPTTIPVAIKERFEKEIRQFLKE
ncbi:polysaccharide pyruvyl transferase family protein [Flavobacteriaceae bacterium]|nr:polysaccharide pyruvyl transferase family protein [Flavobacteriaceae bacterium]